MGRASWSVVDQGLSALSNLLLSVIVARTLAASEFGAFAVAFLTFGLLVALTRAAIGQPLQITFSNVGPSAFTDVVRSALGSALLIGLVAGAVVAVVGLSLTSHTGNALLALAVCLPGLLVQDTARMAFFSSGRSDRAALNDGLWTALEFGALGLLLFSGLGDVAVFILVWGGSATLAALVAILVLRAPPRLRGSLRWLLAQRALTGYLVAEHFLGEGLGQAGILMVGVVGSTADVGSLRAAQVLLGPLNILVTAALLFGVPEVSRRRDAMSPRSRSMLCWGLSGVMAAITVVYSALLLVLPDKIGVELLGETWTGAQTVMLAMCVFCLAIAAGVGPGVVLYGMGRARTTFGLNLLKAPILLALFAVGVWLWGALGAAWALAAAELILLPLVILKAVRALPHPGAPVVVGGDGPANMLGTNDVLMPTSSQEDAPRGAPDRPPAG